MYEIVRSGSSFYHSLDFSQRLYLSKKCVCIDVIFLIQSLRLLFDIVAMSHAAFGSLKD